MKPTPPMRVCVHNEVRPTHACVFARHEARPPRPYAFALCRLTPSMLDNGTRQSSMQPRCGHKPKTSLTSVP